MNNFLILVWTNVTVILKIKNNFRGYMSNKKEILIGWIKSFISVLPAFALFFSFMTVFALHTVIAINFLMIIFDFRYGYHYLGKLIQISQKSKNWDLCCLYRYSFVFLALIIGALHWDAVKLIWQRFFV